MQVQKRPLWITRGNQKKDSEQWNVESEEDAEWRTQGKATRENAGQSGLGHERGNGQRDEERKILIRSISRSRLQNRVGPR